MSRRSLCLAGLLGVWLMLLGVAPSGCAPSAPGPLEYTPAPPMNDLSMTPGADLGTTGGGDMGQVVITGCTLAPQFGCPATMKCTTHDGATTLCDPNGSVQRGGSCNSVSSVDSCLAGSACVNEGSGYSQCRAFCTNNGQCGNRSFCDRSLGTSGVMLCTQPCNAVYPGIGCDGGLGCYAYDFEHTDCRKPGTGAVGALCNLPEDCMPGMACLGPAGATRCRRICTRASNDCPSGQLCGAIQYSNGQLWPTYGYCY